MPGATERGDYETRAFREEQKRDFRKMPKGAGFTCPYCGVFKPVTATDRVRGYALPCDCTKTVKSS